MTVLVRLAYDGTDFHGFARQASGGAAAESGAARPLRTVQGELEAALAGLYRQPVRTRGASRTDAGVHALGQIVGFEAPLEIPARGVLLGLQGRLPRDLAALAVWQATLADGGAVDPRFWNLGKCYRYRIRTGARRLPQTARGEWHLPRGRLDVAAMHAAAQHFVGEHDFAGFRAAGCQARTTVRRMHAVTVRGEATRDELPADPPCLVDDPAAIVEVLVRGEAFLQNMVRIMVGTLVEVGLGRRPPEQVAALLARPERQRSGATAPPEGLTLVEVLWPTTWPPLRGVAALGDGGDGQP